MWATIGIHSAGENKQAEGASLLTTFLFDQMNRARFTIQERFYFERFCQSFLYEPSIVGVCGLEKKEYIYILVYIKYIK